MQIPHTALDADTLRALLEEFVSREGTDYGKRVFSLDEKVQHVQRQLDKGQAFIVYDPRSESCHIVSRDDLSRWENDLQIDRR